MSHRCVLLQDDGGFPIFTNHDSWVASEDESLLEAVEQYGFGNWWVILLSSILCSVLKLLETKCLQMLTSPFFPLPISVLSPLICCDH